MNRNPIDTEKTSVQICQNLPKNLNITHAIFDHDGTLSVIRRGWETVMKEFMLEVLTNGSSDSNHFDLKMKIDEFIAHTTGIRTLEQMDGLIAMIKDLSILPQEQIKSRYEYKQIYLNSLMKRVKKNLLDIQDQKYTPNQFLIKGSVKFLSALQANIKEIYLASGTDEHDVRHEAAVLGTNTFFNGGIYGAKDEFDFDIKSFVMEQISNKIGHENMNNTLVIGDGPVEIREGRKWGAFTIGVASNEETLEGINPEKKLRLIKAGAHVIIGDYQELDKIMELLNFKSGVASNAF